MKKIELAQDALPLSKMVLSPLNSRQTSPDDPEVDGLADSITVIGLLQSPVVHWMAKARKWGVLDGGRRFHALNRMQARNPDEAFDFDAIPVTIAKGTDAQLMQASATANFAREPMTDVEIYEAVRRIMAKAKNVTDEMLAQAFGVTLTRMRRILRLAYVHPDILDAYARNGLDQRALYAYAATADQALQKQVYDELPDWQRSNERMIRRALGLADDSTHEMLQVVGMEAYQAAGGDFEADLFSENSGRVLDPELLGQLYNAHFTAAAEALRAQYPDRELTFGEPPQDRHGTDYRLQAHAEPAVPAEVRERLETMAETVHTVEGRITEAVDWDACEERGLDIAHLSLDGDDVPWDEVPFLPEAAEEAKNLVAQGIEARAELQTLEAQVAAAPQAMPAAATHVSLTVRNGRIRPLFWYPDAKAAGFSTRAGGATAAGQAATAKAADPANPTLTGRAELWLGAARVNMAIHHVLDDTDASARTRARAHKALIYAGVHRLVSPGAGDYGLVHNFDGGTYSHHGSGLEAPDVLQALAAVPGVKDRNPAAGFLLFERTATPEQVDLCAAVLFARRVNPALEPNGSLADEVMSELADPTLARRAWAPTRDFFDLFRKATILAWMEAFKHEIALGTLKADPLKDAAVEYFTADEGAQQRFGLTPAVADTLRTWLPEWLRWPSSRRAGTRKSTAGTRRRRSASRTATGADEAAPASPAQ